VEKLILKILLGISLLLSLAACTPLDELPPSTGIDNYVSVSGAFSSKDQSKLDGTGTVRFNNVLVSNHQDITLKAELSALNAGSYIGVNFYSTSALVLPSSGIYVQFTRQGANVIVTIAANGTQKLVISSRSTYLLPNDLNLVIQFFNAPVPRVIVWQGDSNIYGIATSIIDSGLPGDLNGSLPSAPAGGVFAGLQLNFASVTTARVGTGKVDLP
jgi:hypothetical protein